MVWEGGGDLVRSEIFSARQDKKIGCFSRGATAKGSW